jgi:uncharacterized protein (DUF58 family)
MKPSRTLIALLALLLASAIALGAWPLFGLHLAASVAPLWWGALVTLLLVAAADAVGLRKLPSPQLQRTLSSNLALGRWSDVQLQVVHEYRHPVFIDVFDHLPNAMLFEHLPLRIELQPQQQSQCSYRVRPLTRGQFNFTHCEVSLPSPLRLWHSRRLLELPGQTRVYPDFARIHCAQLLAVDDWLSRLGVRQHQRRGLGLEFHQLRDFRDGDTLRQIDWKATARKRTPIAREYQDERDQQILFLLDCGRRMRSQDDELAHFDHALNACLLLSYVALRQGDAVGLSTFATEQQRFIAPAKGQAQLNVLLNGVYDLQSTQRPADYSTAINHLLARQRRRALVVLVSNLRDEDDEELLAAVKRLSRQHRVLLVSLREEVLDRLRQTPVHNHESALAYCGSVDYLNARASLHERLSANRIPILDARPSELGPELVDQYLAWKKAGVL